MRCKLIAIEGADKQGKQTQVQALARELRTYGYRVWTIEAPIKDMFTYPIIYWMIDKNYAKKHPTLFQGIQFLNKKIFSLRHLDKLIQENHFIIFDRWKLSSKIYGQVLGADVELLAYFDQFIRSPDLNVILHGTKKVRGTDDHIEASRKIQEEVQLHYLDHVIRDPIRSVKIDGDLPVEEVTADIMSMLSYMNMFG